MVKFNRRVDVSYDTMLNRKYSDIYNGSLTPVLIQAGILPTKYLGDFKFASLPFGGDAKIVGAKLNLYVPSSGIVQGKFNAPPKLKVYKSNENLGTNEGASPSGQVDLNVFTHTLSNNPWQKDDFKSFENGRFVVAAGTITREMGPYLTIEDGYEYVSGFQLKNAVSGWNGTKDEFIVYFGQDVQFPGTASAKVVKLKDGWWGQMVFERAISGTGGDYVEQRIPEDDSRIKYEITLSTPAVADVDALNKDNSGFTVVNSTQNILKSEDGADVAYLDSEVGISSEAGSRALKMRTFWKYEGVLRLSMITDLEATTYPDNFTTRTNLSAIDLSQDTVVAWKDLPMPLELDIAMSNTLTHLFCPEITFDLFIEKMEEPVKYTTTLLNDTLTLKRSFKIFFTDTLPSKAESNTSYYHYLNTDAPTSHFGIAITGQEGGGGLPIAYDLTKNGNWTEVALKRTHKRAMGNSCVLREGELIKVRILVDRNTGGCVFHFMDSDGNPLNGGDENTWQFSRLKVTPAGSSAPTDTKRGNWPPHLLMWLSNFPAWNTTGQTGQGDLKIASSDSTDSDDSYGKTYDVGSDRESIVHIDNFQISRMNGEIENCTYSENNNSRSSISIVSPHQIVENKFEYQDAYPDNEVDSYSSCTAISIGTSDGAHHIDATARYLLWNDFSFAGTEAPAEIHDSNIRVGWSSEVENLGTQAQKAVFYNGANANYRGLNVGASSGDDFFNSGTGALSVDNFTQKGYTPITFDDADYMGGAGAGIFTRRENIFASARVLNITDAANGIIEVDTDIPFNIDNDNQYILYVYDGTFDNFTDGCTYNNDQIITHGADAVGDQIAVGMKVTGDGIPSTSYVKSITDSTHFVLGDAAGDDVDTTGGAGGGSGNPTNLTFYSQKLTGIKLVERPEKIYADGVPRYKLTFDQSLTTATSGSFIADLGWSNVYLPSLLISPYLFWTMIYIRNTEQNSNDPLIGRSYGSVLSTGSEGTAGATWNESLFFDGSYDNSWNFKHIEDSSLELQTDYGFGVLSDEDDTLGYLGAKIPEENKYNEIDISGIVVDSETKADATLTLLVEPFNLLSDHLVKVQSDDGANKPYMVTVFEDKIPEKPVLSVIPNEEEPFFPEYTWEVSDSDLWYGLLMVDNENIYNQYHNAVIHFPLNEDGQHGTVATPPENLGSTSQVTISATVLYDEEGLAGNALRFDGNDDYVRFGTSGSTDPTVDCTTEMSVVAHIIPDSASDTRYIVSQLTTNAQKFAIYLNATNQAVADVYWSDSLKVTLTSSSILTTDGETPTCVIITVDTTLKSGNVKLFVNGRLEDMSGLALATGTVNNWNIGSLLNTDAAVASQYVTIGAASNSFLGKIEEVVIYKKCIYPVVPADGKFLFTKPVSELGTSATAVPKSYAARLFVKDYHNIRGSLNTDVAASSMVSWRKASFVLNTS